MKWVLVPFFVLILDANVTLGADLGLSGIASLSSENRKQAEQIAQDFQSHFKDPQAKGRLYLDLDSNVQQTVFSKEGFLTAEDCSRNETVKLKQTVVSGCQPVGTVNSDTPIISSGKIKFSEVANDDGEKSLAVFYEIQYFSDGKFKTGWITGDTVTLTPSFPQMIDNQTEATKNWFQGFCDKLARPGIFSSSPFSGKDINHMADVHSSYKQSLEDKKRRKGRVSSVAEKIAPLIGKCALEPSAAGTKDKNGNVMFEAPKDIKGVIAYDEKALPKVMEGFPAIQKLNIPGLNAQKLVEIDILARTIFAEMASCIPIGSQYSMAVARVLRNRELVMEKNPKAVKEFIPTYDQHWPGKNGISRAASSPVQFSAWNKEIIDFDALTKAREEHVAKLQKFKGLSLEDATKDAKEALKPDPKTGQFYKFNESGLVHTLCPPSNLKEPYYDGHPPSEDLHTIWQNTVKVAVEATLFPEQFNQKTNEMKDVLHYTSGRSSFYNYNQVQPSIEGRKINSNRCLNLWVKPKPKPEAKKKTAKK